MKKFSYFFIFALIFTFVYGCNKTVDTFAKEPKWDRDVCARCGMQVSDPFHSAQIVDGKSGKRYFFDDIGCCILWLQDNDFSWTKNAKIYFTDSLDSSWVKSDEAVFAQGFVTPMAFGVATFRNVNSVPEGKTIISYEAVVQHLNTVRLKRAKSFSSPKEGAQHNDTGGMN